MVLARDCLPAYSWQPTYSSKLVGTLDKLWTDTHASLTKLLVQALRCQPATAWEATSQDSITTAEIPPRSCERSSRKWKRLFFPPKQVANMDVQRTLNYTPLVVLATDTPCTSGSLLEHLNYSGHMAYPCTQASRVAAQGKQTEGLWCENGSSVALRRSWCACRKACRLSCVLTSLSLLQWPHPATMLLFMQMEWNTAYKSFISHINMTI